MSDHGTDHGTFQPVTPHEPNTPITTANGYAQNTDHATDHATHTP
jgi:hypothetical protein